MTPDDSLAPNEEQSGHAAEAESSPRAFVTGTGYALQGVGATLTLSTCCLWAFSGWVLEPPPESAPPWLDDLSGERAVAVFATLGAAVALLSGLGLVAAGVGLQGERRSSGRLAVAITTSSGTAFVVLSTLFVVVSHVWTGALVAGGIAVVMLFLSLLSAHSASVLRQHPPPADLNVATEEFLEELRLKSEARYKEYDV